MILRSTLVWLLILHPALARPAGGEAAAPASPVGFSRACAFDITPGSAWCYLLCGEMASRGVMMCCAAQPERSPPQRPTVPPYKLTEQRELPQTASPLRTLPTASDAGAKALVPQVIRGLIPRGERAIQTILCIWLN